MHCFINKQTFFMFTSDEIPLLFYCSKMCKRSITFEQKLASVQTKCLIRLLNITWIEFIDNENDRKRTNSEPIKLAILKRRWRHLGYVLECHQKDSQSMCRIGNHLENGKRTPKRNLSTSHRERRTNAEH